MKVSNYRLNGASGSSSSWCRDIRIIVISLCLFFAITAIKESLVSYSRSNTISEEDSTYPRRLMLNSQGSQTVHHIHPPNQQSRDLNPEIWARGIENSSERFSELQQVLGQQTQDELRKLCGRCLYRTLTSYVRMHDFGRMSLVMTGDIPAVWIRDSAVQIGSYLPRVAKRPFLRHIIEGALRAQAFFLVQDPWANAYNMSYNRPEDLKKGDRLLGRGGWVWTRNFELDSLAYFYNLAWNYWTTPAVWSPQSLLAEPLMHDAVVMTLQVLEIEVEHEKRSPYRYSELPREGKGPATAVTGLIWSAFRPSDDQQKYSYNIPDNMYMAGALGRLMKLNDAVWHDPYITETATKLLSGIDDGIAKYGMYDVPGEAGQKAYAYEVDGLGNMLTDFDDPNIPSLLSIPLLGYSKYDADVYANTRKRILSPANKFFFKGSLLTGMGSPHTPRGCIWPLATAVQALTTVDMQEQAQALKDLLTMASVNGLSHESVFVNDVKAFTRPEFGWANAMVTVAIEQLLGVDCDEAAEEHRLQQIQTRENAERNPAMPNGDVDRPLYYERLEAQVHSVIAHEQDGAKTQGTALLFRNE